MAAGEVLVVHGRELVRGAKGEDDSAVGPGRRDATAEVSWVTFTTAPPLKKGMAATVDAENSPSAVVVVIVVVVPLLLLSSLDASMISEKAWTETASVSASPFS